jgi:hypothetical protein
MAESDNPVVGEFSSRISRREKSGEASASSGSGVKIVDAENHFPFERIDFIRVGSAHTVSAGERDAENADLLQRLAAFVMAQFQPEALPATVDVQEK